MFYRTIPLVIVSLLQLSDIRLVKNSKVVISLRESSQESEGSVYLLEPFPS